MGNNYHFIEDVVLRKYMRETFKKESLMIGTNYEIVCSLLIKSLFEELSGSPCMVGFRVKQSYVNEFHGPTLTTEQCVIFFNKIVEENSETDFCVAPIQSYNTERNEIHSWTFQLKRFGNFQDEKDTQGLIKYLENIKSRYAKNGSALVIFFDGHRGIDLKSVCNNARLKDFPFKTIFIINVNKDDDNSWYVDMGQIWPIYGYNKYDAVHAIKEGKLYNISKGRKNIEVS